MKRRTVSLLSATAAVALALAGAAAANVPKFQYGSGSIVPGESIGGVRVGMTMNEAKVAWGAPNGCPNIQGTITCQYISPAGNLKYFFATFYVKKGKVVSVEISDAENASVHAKLIRLKTAKGIGIGSSMAAARQKYGIPVTGGGEAGLSHAFFKKGKRCTQFYAPENPYTKVSSIAVGICGSSPLLVF